MAGITFNIIVIRVYNDRSRLTDSNADSGYTGGDKPLSELRFPAAQSTTNGTMPESQASEAYRAEQDDYAKGD
jgi:hypothetical protein